MIVVSEDIPEPAYDLFVIGGGINGVGIARDAAGRGLSVVLAEMGDLAQATSSASTKLFHGGLRYLEYFEIGLVRKALIEREVLLRAMPHISWPMRFVLPYQQELHAETLAAGIKHIYCHICGEHNKNLTFWRQIPMGDPGVVSFGHEVDLEDAIHHFGNTCIIAGNIEPAVIHLGPSEKIYRLCETALEKGRRAPRGFILMPGCGIPPHVPPYNLYQLPRACRDATTVL